MTGAREAWEAAAAALARGDRDTFARLAGAAAVATARDGDVDGASTLARMRAAILGIPASAGDADTAFAAALRRGPGDGEVVADEPAIWWRYLRALVRDLPPVHPFREVATAEQWDEVSFDLMVALLAAGGDGATVDTLARWTGRREAAVAAAFDEDRVLWRGGAVAPQGERWCAQPVLWAACAGASSPLVRDARPELSQPGLAPVSHTPGVVVVTAPSRAIARAAAMAGPVRPVVAADAGLGAIWAARDARWRERPLVLELDGAPGHHAIEVLLTAPHVVVITESGHAAWLATNLGAARPLRVEAVAPLPPAEAARRLASALAVPVTSLRLGHLYATDVAELIATVAARGEEASWALAAELRRRAVAAAGRLAVAEHSAAPSSHRNFAAAFDRCRELFAGAAAWAAPPTAVTIEGEPDLPVWLALELARERGATALVVDLDAPAAWRDVTTALEILHRYGGVLAVRGIVRAPAVCVFALAYAVQRAQVTTVIGLPLATPVPPAIRKLATAL